MSHQDCINKLGQLEPAEIARLFEDLGIKGRQLSSYSCAVAEFSKLEGNVNVRVYEAYSGISGQTGVMNPESVKQFIKGFDNGLYPELIRDYFA